MGTPRFVHSLARKRGQAITELLGQLQQADLRSDDLLLLGHPLISDPPSGSASETNNVYKSKFKLLQFSLKGKSQWVQRIIRRKL
jgi:hypothetical protein